MNPPQDAKRKRQRRGEPSSTRRKEKARGGQTLLVALKRNARGGVNPPRRAKRKRRRRGEPSSTRRTEKARGGRTLLGLDCGLWLVSSWVIRKKNVLFSGDGSHGPSPHLAVEASSSSLSRGVGVVSVARGKNDDLRNGTRKSTKSEHHVTYSHTHTHSPSATK
jgi:hypothetical protein